MKTKKFNQKLSLHKETIAQLNSNELQNAQGGVLTDFGCTRGLTCQYGGASCEKPCIDTLGVPCTF